MKSFNESIYKFAFRLLSLIQFTKEVLILNLIVSENIKKKEFFNNSGILVTGGTGSFGKAFLAELLKRYPKIPRIVIYSRDELKQWEMQQIYPKDKYPQIRFSLVM